MLRYFLKRLAGGVPTLVVIITAAFFLMHAAPGGPFDQDEALPPQIMQNLRAAYGLDQSVWVQYGRYMAGLARGDFGPSLKYRDFTVTELIAQGMPVTLEVGAAALLLALAVGIPLGMLAARHRDGVADHAAMSVAFAGVALPTFVVLPLLGLWFGIHLRWLPIAGWQPGSLRHLVLPAIALGMPPLAVVARLTRASLLEILHSPFIRTAHAKGLPLHTVILRHALPPAMLPVAGYLAPAVASIMTGSLVVESIAGLPGMGRYLVQGALNRDYTLVMGMVIVYSAALLIMGLAVDLLYAWLDPRIRYGG